MSAIHCIPMGRTLAPNRPLYSMIFLMDLRIDESMRLLNPSEVPDDCIIRCIDLRICLRTAARSTGISPDVKLVVHIELPGSEHTVRSVNLTRARMVSVFLDVIRDFELRNRGF